MGKESIRTRICSPVNHSLHLITQFCINHKHCIYIVLLSVRTAVLYADTISGTTEMQRPFEGCGKCIIVHRTADSGCGQEEEDKVKKGRKELLEPFYSYCCEKHVKNT